MSKNISTKTKISNTIIEIRKSYSSNFFPIQSYIERGSIIEIPPFQRDYNWTLENAEELFDDYEEHLKKIKENADDDLYYFIGSILIFEKDNSNTKIIDGQQRITSNFLLYLANNDYKLSSETISKQQWEENNKSIFLTQDAKELFKLNNKDSEEEIKELKEYRIKLFKEDKENSSINNNNNYLRLWKYFYDRISDSEFNEDFDEIFYKVIVSELKVSDSVNNPFKIFESLNSRGKELNIFELVKNSLHFKILSLLDNGEISDDEYDEVSTKINKIFSSLIGRKILNEEFSISSEKTANRLFRFVLMLNCDYSEKEDMPKQFLLRQYKKYISRNLNSLSSIESFLDKIKCISSIYLYIITQRESKNKMSEYLDPFKTNPDYLDRFNYLVNAESYIVLLYKFIKLMPEDVYFSNDLLEPNNNSARQQGSIFFNNEEVMKTIYWLSNIKTRFELVNDISVNTYVFIKSIASGEFTKENLMNKIINVFGRVGTNPKENILVNKNLKSKINKMNMYKKKDITILILRSYERSLHPISDDKLIIDINKKTKTIEHVLPKKVDFERLERGTWSSFISEHSEEAKTNREEREKIHSQYLNKIGNLCLLSKSLNGKIGNLPLKEKKKNVLAINDGSNLSHVQEIFKKNKWKIDDISKRTKKLANYVAKEFNYEKW